MARPKIGLALGSGAARGWAHIGVIEALVSADIEPDIVCGCSIGALVGAAYASNRLPDLKLYAEALTWSGAVKLLDLDLSGGGLVGGRFVIEQLRALGLSHRIEDCAKSFAAVATDLETGREIWLREGPIDEAVRASISIPGVFGPAYIDGRWLADGAVVNPVPVSVCRALGADIIIAVSPNTDNMAPVKAQPVQNKTRSPEFKQRIAEQAPGPLQAQISEIVSTLFPPPAAKPGYFDVLLNSINIMQDQITRARLAGEPPHIMLAPRLGEIEPMQFHRAREAVAEGRACMEQALPALRRYL